MEPEKANALLTRQIEASKALDRAEAKSPEFKKWKRDSEIAIEQIFGSKGRHLSDFRKIGFSCVIHYSGMPADSEWKECQSGLKHAQVIFQSMIEEISEFGVGQPAEPIRDSFRLLEDLFGRFHLVARQLRERHAERTTLEVEDEYDVQYLVHALLHLHFDDIRPEEWTPSYAGGSSRMDFLLKQEKVVIEVKKTRKGLGARELGEQLIIDIQKYQHHPDCKSLICFVYDPEGRVANPRGVENDLKKDMDGFRARVLITPKGV